MTILELIEKLLGLIGEGVSPDTPVLVLRTDREGIRELADANAIDHDDDEERPYVEILNNEEAAVREKEDDYPDDYCDDEQDEEEQSR